MFEIIGIVLLSAFAIVSFALLCNAIGILVDEYKYSVQLNALLDKTSKEAREMGQAMIEQQNEQRKKRYTCIVVRR